MYIRLRRRGRRGVGEKKLFESAGKRFSPAPVLSLLSRWIASKPMEFHFSSDSGGPARD